jgi:transposase
LRNLIRVWVKKLETGAFDEDARAADLLQEDAAKITALERMVGRKALGIEFLVGGAEKRSAVEKRVQSIITGPTVSRSPKDAGSWACREKNARVLLVRIGKKVL